MDISIRPVTLADAAAVAELLNPIIEHGGYTILTKQLSYDDQVAFIRQFPTNGLFYVAIDDAVQRVVGIQDVVPNSMPALQHVGEIATFVDVDSHHKGVGKSLCQATFQAAKELGIRKLVANIRVDNHRAISFYQSQGFAVVGTARQQAFVGGQYIDQLLTEKLLL